MQFNAPAELTNEPNDRRELRDGQAGHRELQIEIPRASAGRISAKALAFVKMVSSICRQQWRVDF